MAGYLEKHLVSLLTASKLYKDKHYALALQSVFSLLCLQIQDNKNKKAILKYRLSDPPCLNERKLYFDLELEYVGA